MTWPSDYQIADYLCQLYYSPHDAGFDFLTFGDGTPNGICWALKHVDDVDLVMLRGSTTLQDWLHDFTAIANPLAHDKLGPLHPGFYEGMPDVWAEIQKRSKGPWVTAGHSLGAGRCAILSGLMLLDGAAPVYRFQCGEPKPGFQKLADALSPHPAKSLRNGDGEHHDLVTDVPLTFPPEEYVHSVKLSYVTAMPGPEIQKSWGIFAWHHMPLYKQALTPAA